MSDMRNEFQDGQDQLNRDGGNTLERYRVTRGEIDDTDDTEIDDTEESGG